MYRAVGDGSGCGLIEACLASASTNSEGEASLQLTSEIAELVLYRLATLNHDTCVIICSSIRNGAGDMSPDEPAS